MHIAYLLSSIIDSDKSKKYSSQRLSELLYTMKKLPFVIMVLGILTISLLVVSNYQISSIDFHFDDNNINNIVRNSVTQGISLHRQHGGVENDLNQLSGSSSLNLLPMLKSDNKTHQKVPPDSNNMLPPVPEKQQLTDFTVTNRKISPLEDLVSDEKLDDKLLYLDDGQITGDVRS